jgi:hypothetical protein
LMLFLIFRDNFCLALPSWHNSYTGFPRYLRALRG